MDIQTRRGDTLWYYSQLFQIPFPLLSDSNEEVQMNNLIPGEKICIPGYQPMTYVVAEDDSCWRIATKFRIPLDALFLLNPCVNPHDLKQGDRLQIPLKVTWMTVQSKTYFDQKACEDAIETLTSLYPFIKKEVIGYSVLGAPLYELSIGNGHKKVHMNASFHANEWMTSAVLIHFLQLYVLALTTGMQIRGLNMTPFYNGVTLSVVPMVNPDGVNLAIHHSVDHVEKTASAMEINDGNNDFSEWKANICGVDLNNQFPSYWEVEQKRKPKKPSSRDFPGNHPLTEPESRALYELVQKREFDRIIAFHSQGREFYWGYMGLEPNESESIAKEFERVSGYKGVREIDSYAGFRDWFIHTYKKPGFTIELGEGKNPLPLTQFESIVQESLGIFLASLYS